MTDETKAMEIQEQEMVETDGTERLRSRATFIPRSDIYETEENVVISVDMPGTSEDNIDITLEKNILTINGISTHDTPDGYSLVFAEFQAGDYERSFRLTDQIDRDGINAFYKDGVLKFDLTQSRSCKSS